jgi:hypothetical protein
MSKQSLSDRLVAYFKARPGVKIASGDIQRLVTTKTSYTAANATRRLRELAEDDILQVDYIKGHAHYRYAGSTTKTVRRVVIEDGVAREIVEEITV